MSRPNTLRMAALLATVVAGCAGQPSATSVPASQPASAAAPSPTVGATAAPSATAVAASASSTTATPSLVPAQRVPVPGGPLGLDVADGHAWVVASDDGRLVDVDLATGATTAMDIGSSASWVKVLGVGHLALSRYGPAPGRGTLEIIDRATGDAVSVFQDPIEGLDVDGEDVWAFAKDGTVLSVDAASKIVGQASVDVAPNEHMDLVGLDGSAFASSDSTAVRQVGGKPLAVSGTIDTGGGVPFTRDGTSIWGARADTVWSIDSATGALGPSVALDDVDEILDLDVDGDDAWIAVRHPGRLGALLHVDLATGTERSDTPMRLPAAVVIDGSTVWVTDYEAGELLGFAR